MNNLRTDVNKLNISKLGSILVNLKKRIDVLYNDVVKKQCLINSKLQWLIPNSTGLESKILCTILSNHKSQYGTNKQSSEKNIKVADKKYLILMG